MASLTFEKKEVEKHITLNQKTIEKIQLLGIPIEVSEDKVEIDVLPNRPDLLSLQGFLRAVKCYLGKPQKKYLIHKPEKNYKVFVDSSVKEVRPYTACAVVKNLNFNDENIKSIIEIQEKLHITLGRNRKKMAIGIYPLEKIKMPIFYKALPPEKISFQPLEFKIVMSAKEILTQHPTGIEYAHLLKDFSKYPIFIDSANQILSMPPIINSELTGKVTEKTKEVFIECSGFNQEILLKTINIIVTALADLGGEIYSVEIIDSKKKKIISPNLKPQEMSLSLENVNKLLGLSLKEKELEKLLPRMGHTYKKGKVLIPAWRTDILHEVDLIEEVAIAYGYDKLVPELPNLSTIAEESKESKLKNKIAELLIGLDFLQISSYHLIKENEQKYSAEKISVANSKTDYKYLRTSLLIPFLRTFAENKDAEYPQKIFETGVVFSKKEDGQIKEKNSLAIAISPGNSTSIKQILDYLSKLLDFSYTLKEKSDPYFIEGRTFAILINGKEVGYFGEVHPETLLKWNIKMPVSFLECSPESFIQNKISLS